MYEPVASEGAGLGLRADDMMVAEEAMVDEGPSDGRRRSRRVASLSNSGPGSSTDASVGGGRVRGAVKKRLPFAVCKVPGTTDKV